jgi:hypothetical protein
MVEARQNRLRKLAARSRGMGWRRGCRFRAVKEHTLPDGRVSAFEPSGKSSRSRKLSHFEQSVSFRENAYDARPRRRDIVETLTVASGRFSAMPDRQLHVCLVL